MSIIIFGIVYFISAVLMGMISMMYYDDTAYPDSKHYSIMAGIAALIPFINTACVIYILFVAVLIQIDIYRNDR